MSEQESPTWCPDPPTAKAVQDRGQLISRECAPSSIDQTGWRPLYITGLLRDILTKKFRDPNNIEEPRLREFIWQDGNTTGILIESLWRWRQALAEKRPAVLITRNAMRNLRLTIGDNAAVDGQMFEHYCTGWVGSSTLFCIHGTGASCEILATEVQRELTQFGPKILQTLGLMRFQTTEVGPVSGIEEATQNFVVPIVVGWAYLEKWQLRSDSPPLRSVDLGSLLLG